jgi:hypothetical protein
MHNSLPERVLSGETRDALDQPHFDGIARSYLDYYHACRPNQGRDNELLVGAKGRRKPTDFMPLSSIRCQKTLGGLLKHYYRAAA